LYDGSETMTLVRDRGLSRNNLKDILSRYKMIVTFNGLSFDIPVINRCFGDIVPKLPHLDLRFPLAKLGFTGGLKVIEQKLGVKRSDSTNGLAGVDAVRLWHDYRMTGNMDSLNLLVEYNTEDIVNLKQLSEFVFKNMKKKIFGSYL